MILNELTLHYGKYLLTSQSKKLRDILTQKP